MKCTCIECNIEFEAKHKTALCPKCKSTPLICVVCGKKFEKKYFPYNQKTCSAKCRGIYRKETGIAKAGAAKMKETKIERYGTLDPAEVAKMKKGSELDPKICPLCGKQFIPNTPRQIYCTGKHYGPCPVCGKKVEIKDISIGPQACSEECRMQRIYKTNLERYGNKDAVNSDHAKQLAKQHSLERYGYEYYSQSPEAKDHYRDIIKERYGVNAPIQYPEFRDKAIKTNNERYGVDFYIQSDEGKNRVRTTQEERYGGIGLASPELKERIKATNRKKYGFDYAVQNSEVRHKIIKSIRERYHVDNFWQTKEDLARRIKDPSKIDNYYSFKQDPAKYVSEHYECKPDIYTLADDLGVTDTPIYDILIQTNCKDVIDRTKMSSMEHQMLDFLKSILPDQAAIDVNNRSEIAPLELDFYLPQYKFAIECNPTTTHNSTINTWDREEAPLAYNYHQIKSKMTQEKGIFLMHIFSYEWEHKREILESMIRNALGLIQNKIYARNTHVVQVSSADASEFLNINHRQGRCNSKIRLGLVTNDTNDLVSLMTFSNTRQGIGNKPNDDSNTYELVRFCSCLNTSVVGGASKLLNYFIKNYNPNKIISFSDVAHTKGSLYVKLGFQEVSRSDPGYCWVKPYGEIFRSRVSCQKHNLTKLFEDVTEQDITSKSERVIMIEHGYVQVFDSGVIRWEYNADNSCI